MKSGELIAVVIPVYNVRDYLGKCLDSVLAQSYAALEIVLVDDGSTDGSGDVCDSYSLRDVRVKVVHIENSGVAKARERGLAMASARYVVFVDADDYLPERAIEKLAGAMTDEVDIVMGSQCTVTSKGEIPMPLVARELDGVDFVEDILHHHRLSWAPWGKLYRTELFSSESFPRFRNCEDLLMCVDIAQRVRKVRIISDVVYYYLQRECSASHRYSCTLATEQELCLMLKEYLERGGFLPQLEGAYYHFSMLRLYMCAMSGDRAVRGSNPWVTEVYKESRKSVMAYKERLQRLAIRCPLLRTLFRLKG